MTAPYYQDDLVTLYLGDCITETAWLDADVLVTDPPYGMSHKLSSGSAGKYAPIAGDGDTSARDAMLALWGGSPGIVFGTWRIQKPAGVINVLIWDKGTDLGMGQSTPWGLSHEEAYVLGKWPALVAGGRSREGGTPSRVPSVLRVDKPNNAAAGKPDHPTPKPVTLMGRLIERCPAGVIADPFAGSGSTLLAARNLGRKSIGVEMEERYCEVIAKRLQQQTFNFEEAA